MHKCSVLAAACALLFAVYTCAVRRAVSGSRLRNITADGAWSVLHFADHAPVLAPRLCAACALTYDARTLPAVLERARPALRTRCPPVPFAATPAHTEKACRYALLVRAVNTESGRCTLTCTPVVGTPGTAAVLPTPTYRVPIACARLGA